MRTFKQFLSEESGSLSQMLDLYNEDYSEWPLQHPLGRFDSRPINKLQVLKPRMAPRKRSLAGSQMLQQALKKQPSWAKVPDRDYSIFVSTAPGSGSYANMNKFSDELNELALIPNDNAVIAMIEDDFNVQSVTFGGRQMKLYEVFTKRSIDMLHSFKDNLHDKQVKLSAPLAHDVESFKKLYDYLVKHLSQDDVVVMQRTLAPAIDFVEKVTANELPPEFFGITLTTPANYRKPSAPHEAWFHADALVMPIKQYEKFYQLVTNQ